MARIVLIAGLTLAGGLIAASGISSAQSQNLTQASCEALNGRQIPAAQIALPTNGIKITAARIVPAVTASAAPAAAPAGPPAQPPAAPLGAPPQAAGGGRGGAPGGGPPGGFPAGGFPGGGRGAPTPNPEYCRVEGSILPIDPNAPSINFALAVPTDWNGSSWHLGGSANNGVIPGLTGTGSGNTAPGSPSLLAQGYAVYGSDSGHQNPDNGWVNNAEAWNNFAYQQLKKTGDASQGVLQALFGRKAKLRYFSGTSQGGREALEVVARYPADYDGVYANVPLAYFQGLMIDPTLKVKAEAAPGAWIPPAKFTLINTAVAAACDSMDGLTDGVISNYATCIKTLDPTQNPKALSNLRCAGGADDGDTCLSDAQLKTLTSLFAAVKYPYPIPNGQPDWPGWAPGGQQGLLATTKPDPAQPNGPFGIGAPVQRRLWGQSDDFNLYNFDLVKYRPRLEALSREVDVPSDWSAFFKRGGKLILSTAGADAISNPRAQMRLYDQVVKKSGQSMVDAHVRYYVIPMADHGGNSRSVTGEAMPSSWNPVGMLRDWVEQSVTPADAPVLSTFTAGQVSATRPICRYPAYPYYVGGDKSRDAAYSCRRP